MYVGVFRSSEAGHTPGLSADAPRKPDDVALAAEVPSAEVAAEAGGPLGRDTSRGAGRGEHGACPHDHGREDQGRVMRRLDELKVGESGKVTGYTDRTSAYRRKLLSMGLTPGTVVKVVRKAPLGDPIEIDLRGTALSVRKDEARIVSIEMA